MTELYNFTYKLVYEEIEMNQIAGNATLRTEDSLNPLRSCGYYVQYQTLH
jgi:hypothetical protein